jgi:hypothetical protein
VLGPQSTSIRDAVAQAVKARILDEVCRGTAV